MPPLSKKSKAATARRAAQQVTVLIGKEEDPDDYFDEEIWEVVHEDNEPDSDDDDLEHDVMNGVGLDVEAAERLQVMETRWKAKGLNWGAGTSRATHYRQKKQQKMLKETGDSHKVKLPDFFTKQRVVVDLIGDDNSDGNDSDCGNDSDSDSGNDSDIDGSDEEIGRVDEDIIAKHTIAGAIAELETNQAAVVRNNAQNRKNKIDHWYYLQALSILRYLQLVESSNGGKKVEASRKVAAVLFGKLDETVNSYKSQLIRNWAKNFLVTGELTLYRQGKHRKTFSIITDETNQEFLKEHLRSMKNIERTPANFLVELNTTLLGQIPRAPTQVSLRTAERWMHYLNFSMCTATKGYYTDDHNRADVVKYRDGEFLPAMETYERRFYTYSGDDMSIKTPPTNLKEGEKPLVLITHDESTLYANDGKKFMWTESKKKVLLPKSNGTSIMISGFVCECHGFMKGIIDGTELKSYKLFEAGVAREGWFTNDDLVQQLKDVLPLVKALHPDDDLLFGFDNSMTHHKRAPDGLQVTNLPLKDDGKNATMMRNGYFPDSVTGDKTMQNMQTETGKAKGLRSILEERKRWRAGMPRLCGLCKSGDVPHEERRNKFAGIYAEGWHGYTSQCCAVYCLSHEPDFLAQREWLREVVEDDGHLIIFYPKFHCELNYIEMIWAYLKAYLRKHCKYSYPELKAMVPNTLEEKIPIATVRRQARHCYRFMSAYRMGLQGPLADYAMKKYSSHRRIPEGVLAEIQQQYVVDLENKLKRKMKK